MERSATTLAGGSGDLAAGATRLLYPALPVSMGASGLAGLQLGAPPPQTLQTRYFLLAPPPPPPVLAPLINSSNANSYFIRFFG